MDHIVTQRVLDNLILGSSKIDSHDIHFSFSSGKIHSTESRSPKIYSFKKLINLNSIYKNNKFPEHTI